MPKTVFDVLTSKIDDQLSSAHTFVAGGSSARLRPLQRSCWTYSGSGVRKIDSRRPLAQLYG